MSEVVILEQNVVITEAQPVRVIEVAKTGPQGPAGQLGANLYGIQAGLLADRPIDPDVGQGYVTTDTDEFYIAVNAEE